MHLRNLLIFSLAAPIAALAQTTTVFNDTFANGSTVDQAPAAPTSSSTSYEYLGSVAGASASINPNHLVLVGATNNFFGEVQALFTTNPITLTSAGDFLDLTIIFTGSNIISSGTAANNSSLNVGLYRSGSTGQTFPAQGYNLTSGTTNAPVNGNAQTWQGYVGRAIGNGGGTIRTRPIQSGTTAQNQDVLFFGASSSTSYNTPSGAGLTTLTSGSAVTLSSTGSPSGLYTVDYRATLSGSGIGLNYIIYSGSGTLGTQLFTQSSQALTTDATYLGSTFDAFALGWRQNAGSSIASSMDISSVTVTANVSTVPEPATWAMMFAGVGMLLGLRRFRRR